MANQSNDTREKNKTDFETPLEDKNGQPPQYTTSESILPPVLRFFVTPQTNIDDPLVQLNSRNGKLLLQRMMRSAVAYEQLQQYKEQHIDLRIRCGFFHRLRYIKIKFDSLTSREGYDFEIRTIPGISKMCPRPLVHGAYTKAVQNDTLADFMIIEKRWMDNPVVSVRELEVQNSMQPPAKTIRRSRSSAEKEKHNAAIQFWTKNTHLSVNGIVDSIRSSTLPAQQSQTDATAIDTSDSLSQLTGGAVESASSLTFVPRIFEFERLQKFPYFQRKQSVRQWTRRIVLTSKTSPEPHRGGKTPSYRTRLPPSIHNIWFSHDRHLEPGSGHGRRGRGISPHGVNKGAKDKDWTQHWFDPGSLHQDLAADSPEETAIGPSRGCTGCPSTPWTLIFRVFTSASQLTLGYLPVRFLAFSVFVQGSNATSSSPLSPLSAYHLGGVLTTSLTFFSIAILVNSRLQRRTHQFQLGALALLLAFINSYTVDDLNEGYQLAYIPVFLALFGLFLLFRALFRVRSGCQYCGRTNCNGNCGAGSSSGTNDYV